MSLVQLTATVIEIRGPAHSYTPPDLLELQLAQLAPNQRVVQIDWRRGQEVRGRKTVDWRATVWIEARL